MPIPTTGFPQTFGRYRLLRKLARGGMAELFLAADPQGQPVVVKRILPQFAQETEFLKMFLNEARIAALLHHPGIVKIFDLGKEGEHLYIVMEYVDGFDLETLVKLNGGKLPPGIAARAAADVCDALYYANNMCDLEGKPLDVVHRDVTPGNVMITRSGQIKLVDFGVAKAAAQLERTRPGVVKGKFRYMSPEQIAFKELDGRSDLFSLGVLLYEVTTGEQPFERKQLLELVHAISQYDPPPPSTLIDGFPKAISAAIMRALRKDREERFQSGREMQQALEQALKLTPTGKDELAAFVTHLAATYPAEMAPVAPEFSTGKLIEPASSDPDAPAWDEPPARVGHDTSPLSIAPSEELPTLLDSGEDGLKESTSSLHQRPGPAPSSARGPGPRPSAAAVPAAAATSGPIVVDDEDLEDGEDGPDTLKVIPSPFRQPEPSLPPAPAPAASAAPAPQVPQPREPGADDELELPTISNVRSDVRKLGASAELDTSKFPQAIGAAASRSRFRVSPGARTEILRAAAIVLVLALVTWFGVTSLSPNEAAQAPRIGERQGKRPAKAGPSKSDPEPAPNDQAADEPSAPREEKKRPAVASAVPAADAPKGELSVDGPIGTMVAVDTRAPQEVPFRIWLPPGTYPCQFRLSGGTTKPCRTITIDSGKKSFLQVP